MVKLVRMSVIVIIGLSISGQTDSQDAGEENVLEVMKAFWQQHSGYDEQTIKSGEFKGLEIGQSPSESAVVLGSLGVSGIIPKPNEKVARSPGEIDEIKNAEGLRIGHGAFFIFEGDLVKESLIGRSAPIREQLRSATTRSEVISLLKTVVGPSPSNTVSTHDPHAKPLYVHQASQEELSAFSQSYDQWEATFRDDEGYWGIELRFRNGLLVCIETKFSKLEPL